MLKKTWQTPDAMIFLRGQKRGHVGNAAGAPLAA